MSVLGLIAGAVCAVLAVLGLLRIGQRRGPADLGTVSDQWRAQQRASPNDSSY